MTILPESRHALAQELCGRPVTSQADATARLTLAKDLLRDGHDALADALRDQVLSTFPDHDAARSDAMAQAMKRADFSRLADLAAAGLAHRPDDLELLRARGIARRRLGDLDGAIIDLRHVKQKNPSLDALALMELGRALSATKQHSEAIAAFDMAVAKAPKHPPVLHAQIVAYREAELSEAVDLACAARAMHPERPIFLEEHLACLAKLGRHSDVVTTADAAPFEQMQSPRARSILARSLLVTGPAGRAEGALVDLLADLPDAPWLHSGLIDLAMRRGDIAAAIERAETGCRARPNDRLARLRFVQILEQAGYPERAEAQIIDLTEQDPDFPRGWMERARLALARGDQDEADFCYARILDLDPAHRLARRARIRLAQETRAFARAFALCWIDPTTAPRPNAPLPSVMVAPAFPVHALEIAKFLAEPGLQLRVLDMIASTLPETLLDHLPDIARHAESLGKPEIAAACYREIAARPSLSVQAAIPLVQRAHAMAQPQLTDAIIKQLCQKLPADQRERFELRAAEICHGPDAALALARNRLARQGERSLHDALHLGRLLSFAGHNRLAVRYLARCARHWPEAESIHFARAQALLHLNRIRAAEHVLHHIKAEFPTANTEALALKILISAHRPREAFEKVRACLDQPDFPLPLLECLLLAIAVDDLEAAEKLGAMYRAVPRSNISASVHFGLTHPGALLNEMRIYREAACKGGHDSDSAARLARDFFCAANQVLDRHFLTLQASSHTETVVPRRIFQYWDKPTAPPELEALMQGWANAPGFDYFRLDAAGAVAWLRRHFDSQHAKAFAAANHVAEASDFLRLCVLFRHGGIYMDSDNKLIGDPNLLIEDCGPLLLFRDPFGAIPNDVIATIPEHPIIGDALAMARDALLSREKDLTWGKTGPGLLTRAVAGYLVDQPDAAHRHLRLLPLRAMACCIHPCMNLPYKMTPKYWNDRVGPVASEIRSTMTDIAAS